MYYLVCLAQVWIPRKRAAVLASEELVDRYSFFIHTSLQQLLFFIESNNLDEFCNTLLLDTHSPSPPARCLPRAGWAPFWSSRARRPTPNTYRFDLPATWRVFPEFNVKRLRPYLCRAARLGGDADVGPQQPVLGADSAPEHHDEVQELLKFEMRFGRPYVLVRWTGLDAAGHTWEPLDNLTTCEAAIAAFEPATGRSLPRPAPPPLPLAGAVGDPAGAARRPGHCADG